MGAHALTSTPTHDVAPAPFRYVEGVGASSHRVTNVDAVERTGDCATCGRVRVKPRTRPSGTITWSCRQSYRPSPEVRAAQRRRARLVRYGLTPEQADALGDACAICGRTNADRRLAIDHRHSDGKVRGRLCTACNRGLGYFGDDPDRLAAAIDYLARTAD